MPENTIRRRNIGPFIVEFFFLFFLIHIVFSYWVMTINYRWVVFMVSADSRKRSLGAHKAQFVNFLAKIRNFNPFDVISFLCIISWTCPDPSHVHPKELSPSFVRHALLPPSGINTDVGVYSVTSWGQRKSTRGVIIGMRMYLVVLIDLEPR